MSTRDYSFLRMVKNGKVIFMLTGMMKSRNGVIAVV